MTVTFVEPDVDTLVNIALNMRQADKNEVMASHGQSPIEAVLNSWEQSDSSVIVCVDDKPCVVIGLVIHCLVSGKGSPWMLGADLAMKHKREFLRLSPGIIGEMLRICPTLTNYVHAENQSTIRWLKWVGFSIDEPEPYGVAGELFHRFKLQKV